MKFFVYPYASGSESAKALRDELEGKMILREGSQYVNKPDHVVINWGASDCPYGMALNADVKGILNKKTFFQRLAGTGLTPPFATNPESALGALNFPIFCRTKLTGHDGEGIVIADDAAGIVPCSLYVAGVVKDAEYRVHVGRMPDGTVKIIGTQKKIHSNVPGTDTRIWVGDTTSFVWTVNGSPVVLPQNAWDSVYVAFEKFPELTFGAFDVTWNMGTNRAYVLEINSAPMKTPETTKRYGDFFKAYADALTPPMTKEVAVTTLLNFAYANDCPDYAQIKIAIDTGA